MFKLTIPCETMALSTHDKTRALGREFLNDWDAIFRILEYPAWPLTNNEAERALRHWVILRKITYGTRSPQGSRALARPGIQLHQLAMGRFVQSVEG